MDTPPKPGAGAGAGAGEAFIAEDANA